MRKDAPLDGSHKNGRVTEFALEVTGYRLLEFVARGAVEIFGDKTFNS